MFVGGLSWQTTEETMREYFAKFGPVVEAMVNNITNIYYTLSLYLSLSHLLNIPSHLLNLPSTF